MTQERRVAIMLEIEWVFKRHTDVFAGTQRFASECGNWKCAIDEIADYRLPVDGAGPVPYDGVIARAGRRLAMRAKRCGVPAVNVWVNSPTRGLPCVFPDMNTAGRMVAEHLLDRGLRSFACLRQGPDKACERAGRGFVQRLSEAGFDCESTNMGMQPLNSKDPSAWRRLERVFGECIDSWKPPVGVFLLVYDYVRQLVQMCADRGLRIPEDVALVTSEDEFQRCEHPPPSLSSIEFGYERVGYEAAVLLQRMMDGQPPPKEEILVPPEGVVVRASTDFFAVGDELVAEALRYITANSQQRIGAEDVAEAVLTSRATLHQRFQKHLGRSVAAEIRRLRIERAKRQLTDSKRSIKIIAEEAGFSSVHHLDEVFRRHVGGSPSEYRRQHGR